MQRLWMIAAAVNGLLAVGLGAYAAHGLAVPPERLDAFRTAVNYQMWHALALLGVAVLRRRLPALSLDAAGGLFLAGVLLFSGTLYGIGLSGSSPLPIAAPIGGISLMAGWAMLGVFAFSYRDYS